MRIRLILALLLTLLTTRVDSAPPPDFSLRHYLAHTYFIPQGGSSNPPIVFRNQGIPLGVSFTVNCSTGMSCSFVSGVMTLTATGGAGIGGSIASPQVAFATGANTLGGSTTFTWADGTNATGVFMGPPSVGFSTNIAPLANPFNLAELQVNRHVLVGDSDVGATSIQNFLQSDKNLSLVGTDTVVDATNAVSGSIVGIFATAYYNVPVGQTNANLQTGFEGQVFAYGAGSSGAAGGAAVFEASGAQNTGTGTVANLVGYYATQNFNTGGGTVHNSYGFHALDQATVGDTLNAAFHADPQTAGAHNWGFYSDLTNKDHLGLLSAKTISTDTNCSSAASPAVCASAAAGSIAVPTGTNPTLLVNTTAVTANSQILYGTDETLGARLSVTCNTTLAILAAEPVTAARVAGTSFTVQISGTVAVNPVCLSYFIVN